jgi:WD40 repeat protein
MWFNDRMLKKLAIISILILVILSACSPAPTQAVPTPFTATNTPTLQPIPTATALPIPPSILQPSATPTQSLPTLPRIDAQNVSQLAEQVLLGDGRLSQVLVSPGGGVIAYASTIGIRFLDSTTLADRGFLESTIPVTCIDFSPDGVLLAAGYDDGHAKIYRLADLLGKNFNTLKPLADIKAHTFQVTSIHFSPDGSMLATSSRDRTANIWRVQDGKRIRSLAGFLLAVTDVAFSSDNKTVAAGSLDGTLRVWDLKSGVMWNSIGQGDRKRRNEQLFPASLLFDPQTSDLFSGWGDGSLAAWHWQDEDAVPKNIQAGKSRLFELIRLPKGGIVSLDDDGQATQWNTANQNGIASLQKNQAVDLEQDVVSLSIAPDGKAWAVGSSPAIVSLMDTDSYKVSKYYSRAGQESQVITAGFSADGRMLFSGGGDGMLRIWNMIQPEIPIAIPLSSNTAIQQVVISTNQKWLAVAFAKQVQVFALDDLKAVLDGSLSVDILKPVVTITTSGAAHRIALSPDGNLLASSVLLAQTVQVWSLPDGKKLADLDPFKASVEALVFSPLSNSLAAGGADHKVYLWQDPQSSSFSAANVKPVTIKAEFAVTGLSWSNQGDLLAMNGTGHQARVVHPSDGSLAFALTGPKNQVVTTAFSPDGSLIAIADTDGVIRVYQSRDSKQLVQFSVHSGMVNVVLFSPQGDRLVSCGEDGTIRLWNIQK